MRVLLTGIGGFVGRHLSHHLFEAGHRVFGLALTKAAGDDDTIEAADLCQPAEVERVVAKIEPEAVVHLAGLSRTNATREEYWPVNVEGTRNLIDALASRDVERIVFASSGLVYGSVASDLQPIDEHREPAPISAYGESKVAAESFVLGHPKGIVVRSFNTIGPGQQRGFVVPDLAYKLAALQDAAPRDSAKDRGILHCKDLKPELDFLHIDDAVAGYRTILESGQPGSVYNLSSGETCTIAFLLEQLLEISGLRVDVRSKSSDSRVRMCGDNQRLRALGWSPKKTVPAAVQDFWQDFTERRRNEDSVGDSTGQLS